MRTALKKRLGQKGFTLIELLIVITIIGILAVALIPRVSQGPAKARDVKRKADINNTATALELYYSENGSYPTAAIGCMNASNISGMGSYLQGFPTDPSSTSNSPVQLTNQGCSTDGEYVYASDGSSVTLLAELEGDDGGDNIYCGTMAADIDPSQVTSGSFYDYVVGQLSSASCGTGVTHYYVVVR